MLTFTAMCVPSISPSAPMSANHIAREVRGAEHSKAPTAHRTAGVDSPPGGTEKQGRREGKKNMARSSPAAASLSTKGERLMLGCHRVPIRVGSTLAGSRMVVDYGWSGH